MPEVPFTEIGGSGLNAFDGFVHEERLRALMEPRRRHITYQEMIDNDAVIGTSLTLIDTLAQQVDWGVEPFMDHGATGDPLPADRDNADFAWSCFQDLNQPWRAVVSDIFSFVPHGYSWHEITFKLRNGPGDPVAELAIDPNDLVSLREEAARPPPSQFSDGRIGWHKIAGRAQTTLWRWEFDAHGDVLGMWQSAPPAHAPVFIPRAKSLHFRTTTQRGNPEGKSALRNSYRSWYMKKVFEDVMAVGVERDLAGLPIIRVPMALMRAKGNMSADNVALRNDFERMGRNLRRGSQEVVMLPSDADPETKQHEYDLSLLTTGGRRQFDIKALLEYYDRRIAMTTLTDVALLGHERVGSLALADNKTDMLGLEISTLLDVVTDQFNRRGIPQLFALNGLPVDRPSRLVHGDLETQDLDKLGQYVMRMSQAGMINPTPETEAHLRTQADLPESDPEMS